MAGVVFHRRQSNPVPENGSRFRLGLDLDLDRRKELKSERTDRSLKLGSIAPVAAQINAAWLLELDLQHSSAWLWCGEIWNRLRKGGVSSAPGEGEDLSVTRRSRSEGQGEWVQA